MVWNQSGSLLLSGSDDCRAILWALQASPAMPVDAPRWTLRPATSIQTGHHGNVFGVAFMPRADDSLIATCAMDGEVRLHDIHAGRPVSSAMAYKHQGFARQLATSPSEAHMLWSVGDDGIVAEWDHRVKQVCPIITLPYQCPPVSGTCHLGTNSIAVNPTRPHCMAVAGNDAYVRVYDRRMLRPLRPAGTSSALRRMRLWSSSSEAHQACLRLAPQHLLPEITASEDDHQHFLHNQEESLLCYPTHCCWDAQGETVAATYSRDAVYTWRVFRDASQGGTAHDQGGTTHGPSTTSRGTPQSDIADSVPPRHKAAVLAAAHGVLLHPPDKTQDSAVTQSALAGLNAAVSFLRHLSSAAPSSGSQLPAAGVPHSLWQAVKAVAGEADMPVQWKEWRDLLNTSDEIIWEYSKPLDRVSHDALGATRQLLAAPMPQQPWQQMLHLRLLAAAFAMQPMRPLLGKAVLFASHALRVGFLQYSCYRPLLHAYCRLDLLNSAHDVAHGAAKLAELGHTIICSISDPSLPDELSLATHCDLSKQGVCCCFDGEGGHPPWAARAAPRPGATSIATKPFLDTLKGRLSSVMSYCQSMKSELRDVASDEDHPLQGAGARRDSVMDGTPLFKTQSTHPGQTDTSQNSVAGASNPRLGVGAAPEQPAQDQEPSVDDDVRHLYAKLVLGDDEKHLQETFGHLDDVNFGQYPPPGSCKLVTNSGIRPAHWGQEAGLPLRDFTGVYFGHRNADTDIKECHIWDVPSMPSFSQLRGAECGHGRPSSRCRLLLAGSDDGFVFVWDGASGHIIARLKSDPDIVNCIAPHPRLPVMAVSGISSRITMWAPSKALLCSQPAMDMPTDESHAELWGAVGRNLEHIRGAIEPDGDGLLNAMHLLAGLDGGLPQLLNSEDGSVQCAQQ